VKKKKLRTDVLSGIDFTLMKKVNGKSSKGKPELKFQLHRK